MPHERNQSLIAKFSSSPGGSGDMLIKRNIVNNKGEQANPANSNIESVASLIRVPTDGVNVIS